MCEQMESVQQSSHSEVMVEAILTSKQQGRSDVTEGTRRGESGGGKQRKQKKRRQKIRKWKPYSQMTWEEKQEYQEYENQRMERHLHQMEQLGKRKPIAPYNTTQFLIDDKPSEVAFLKTPPFAFALDSGNESHSSTDEAVAILEPSPDYLDHDFESAFTAAHVSRLEAMSKEELVRHCMGVERLVQLVQSKLSSSRQPSADREGMTECPDSEQAERLFKDLEEVLKDANFPII